MLPWLKEKILRKQRWLRTRTEEIKPQCSEYQDDGSGEEEISTEHLFLRIVVSRMGVILKLQVSYFDSGLQVKEKALKKLETFHSPTRSSSSSSSSSSAAAVALFSNDIHSYRLVRSSTKTAFKDFYSILNHRVRDGEEFLLIAKRACGQLNQLLNVQNSHGPSEKEILNRTRHLPLIRSSLSPSLNLSMDSAFFQSDLQHDLRKILAEIAKYSAFILGSLPFAEKLIKYYRQKILMSLNNHQDIVRLLMEMGFSRKNVLRALKLQGNNYSLALDWLVENVEKEEIDVEDEEEGQSNLDLSCESIEDIDNSYKKLYSKTFPSANSIFFSKHKAISIKDKVEGLLEIVKFYTERNEEPIIDTRADTINKLVNMGFSMDEIVQALDVSKNHQTACEWLLENSSNTKNITTLRESIFVESHILKILFSTPQIQFSLSTPKFFIAYCSLLENYSSLNIFFNDIESQSLLQFILRTYHEEKIYLHTFDRLRTSSSSSNHQDHHQ